MLDTCKMHSCGLQTPPRDACFVSPPCLHAGNASHTSRTFNHPQLRLWEDAQLTAGLQGVQDAKELQAFLKGWAQQHLPAKLAQLQALAQQQEQQQAQQQAGGSAAGAAATAPAAEGAALGPQTGEAVAGGVAAGGPSGTGFASGSAALAAVAAADRDNASAGWPSSAAVLPGKRQAAATEPVPAAPATARLQRQATDAPASSGQVRRRVSPRDPRIASAAAAGASGAAAAEADVRELMGGNEERAAAAGTAAPEAAAPEAVLMQDSDHAASPNPPASQAAVQLPPVSSFAGDSGRPLKRRMLSKLQPLLEAAGASVQHVSGKL
jgi:hypothetical protein